MRAVEILQVTTGRFKELVAYAKPECAPASLVVVVNEHAGYASSFAKSRSVTQEVSCAGASRETLRMSLTGIADSFELNVRECAINNELRIQMWTIGYGRGNDRRHGCAFDEWCRVFDSSM